MSLTNGNDVSLFYFLLLSLLSLNFYEWYAIGFNIILSKDFIFDNFLFVNPNISSSFYIS